MKKMHLTNITLNEAKTKLEEDLNSLQNFRFQHALQQLEDLTVLSKTKKEIAQLRTVINEFKLGIRKNEGVQK